MSRVIDKITLTHAEVILTGNAGVYQWLARHINGYDEEPAPLEIPPHHKLLLAILLDAIETLKNPQAHDRVVYERKFKSRKPYKNKRVMDPILDAHNWLLSDDDSHVFDFVSICDVFKWDASWVRQKALESIAQVLEKPPCPRLRRGQVRKNWQVKRRAKKRVLWDRI